MEYCIIIIIKNTHVSHICHFVCIIYIYVIYFMICLFHSNRKDYSSSYGEEKREKIRGTSKAPDAIVIKCKRTMKDTHF